MRAADTLSPGRGRRQRQQLAHPQNVSMAEEKPMRTLSPVTLNTLVASTTTDSAASPRWPVAAMTTMLIA